MRNSIRLKWVKANHQFSHPRRDDCKSRKDTRVPYISTALQNKNQHKPLHIIGATIITFYVSIVLKSIIEILCVTVLKLEIISTSFCDSYNLIRRDMLYCVSAICNPSLNIMLHGNEDLFDEHKISMYL